MRGQLNRSGDVAPVQVGQLKDAVQAQAAQVGQLLDAVHSLTPQRDTFREQLHEAVTESAAQKSHVSEQDLDIFSLKADCDARKQTQSVPDGQFKSAVQAQAVQVGQLLDAVFSLAPQRDTFRDQLHEAVTESAAQKSLVLEQDRDRFSLKSDCEANQQAQAVQVGQLEDKVQAQAVQVGQLVNAVQSLTSQHDTFGEQLHEAVADHEAQQSLVSKQGQDILSLKADCDAKEQAHAVQVGQLEDKVQAQAAQVGQLEETVQSLTSQRDTFREQLHGAEREQEAQNNLVSKKDQDILSLKADCDAKEHANA
jgi:chromosome segregation ATPase